MIVLVKSVVVALFQNLSFNGDQSRLEIKTTLLFNLFPKSAEFKLEFKLDSPFLLPIK